MCFPDVHISLEIFTVLLGLFFIRGGTNSVPLKAIFLFFFLKKLVT